MRKSTANGNRQSSRWNNAHAIPHDVVRDLHILERAPVKQYLTWMLMTLTAGMGAVVAWQNGYYWLMSVLCIAAGVLAHVIPLAFHDASHQTLFQNRKLNEFAGLLFGTSILVPLSLYRYAHGQHHTYLATNKDPELWPFTDTTKSRAIRILAVLFETFGGIIATPLLFARAFLTADSLKPKMRNRILWEYALIACWIGLLVSGFAFLGMREEIFVGFIVPWVIAGMLQTTNKYVEHLGMMGEGIIASTRTVVPDNSVGRWFSNLWHNVAHHATHHLYARVPHEKLPAASIQVIHEDAPEGTVFSSYCGAFFAMVCTLGNPRIGAHWRTYSDDDSKPVQLTKSSPSPRHPSNSVHSIREKHMTDVIKFTDANFQVEVINSEQPVLVDVWAPWCGPCRRVSPLIEQLAEQFAGSVKVGKLHADDNSATAGRYDISSIPTVMVFLDGEVQEQLIGVQSKEMYEQAANNALAIAKGPKG